MIQTKVYILYTGGTIGMAPKDSEDPYSPLVIKPLSELMCSVPGLVSSDNSPKHSTFNLKHESGNLIEVTGDSLKEPVDSAKMNPEHWCEIALKIRDVYHHYDGIVILHGTDTMAYTSSALSFMLENLGKPVVITGAQLPISSIRTDAVMNLINAIFIAGYKATHLPLIHEVMIVFADRIIRGCRASKVSTADWAGFDSPNAPLLGSIGEHIVINTSTLLPPLAEGREFFVNLNLDSNISCVNIFPGFSNKQMEKLFLDPEIKGILLRSYGTGNVPDDKIFLNIISRSIKGESEGGVVIGEGRLIVNLSQCSMGIVEMGRYETSTMLIEYGVLSGLDMTPEAALAKLMWALGTQIGAGRNSQMQISQRGEQTENLFDLRFGGIAQNKAKENFTARVTPDGRLDRVNISRAMLRISALGVVGAALGENIYVRVFMNMPIANIDTDREEGYCIAEFDFSNAEKNETYMKNMTHKMRNVIGDGDGEVNLTLVAEKDTEKRREKVSIYFDGLYIAVYAKA